MWTKNWNGKYADHHILALVDLLMSLLDGDFDSFDPRDRVFALLGVVGDGKALPPYSGRLGLYGKSAAELFRDLAISIIKEQGSLDILAGYSLK
jgi:hypothetical protein